MGHHAPEANVRPSPVFILIVDYICLHKTSNVFLRAPFNNFVRLVFVEMDRI